MEVKTLIALLLACLLISSNASFDVEDESSEGVEDSHVEKIKREFQISGVGNEEMKISSEYENEKIKDHLEYSLVVGSSGIIIRAEYKNDVNDAKAEYDFRVAVRRIVSYNETNGVPGFQIGEDVITKSYGSNTGSGSSNFPWTFVKWAENTVSNGREFVAKTNEAKPILTVVLKTAFTNQQVIAGLTIQPKDIKFDLKLDVDALQALGLGENIAIMGVIQSKQKLRRCENVTSTASACVNGAGGALVGYLRWANSVSCNGTTVPIVPSMSSSTDSNEKVGSDDDSATESAKVLAWALLPDAGSPAPSGVCVWDPQVVVSNSDAKAIVMSALLLVAALLAIIM